MYRVFVLLFCAVLSLAPLAAQAQGSVAFPLTNLPMTYFDVRITNLQTVGSELTFLQNSMYNVPFYSSALYTTSSLTPGDEQVRDQYNGYLYGLTVFQNKRFYVRQTNSVNYTYSWQVCELGQSQTPTCSAPIDGDKYARMSGPIVVGSRIFLIKNGSFVSTDVYASDGTAQNTHLVRTIPGNALGQGNSLSTLALNDSTLLFSATTNQQGHELWRTDGTAAGTALVRDIRPGSAGANPILLGTFGNFAYLSADDGTHGRELWRTDGTAAGTTLVADLNPGAAGGLSDDTDTFAVLGNRFFFSATDGSHGPELWSSDGTAAGTHLLADINAGGNGGNLERLTVVGDALLFSASDGVFGQELWRSDGTAAGTHMVADIETGGSSNPADFAVLGGQLFFSAYTTALGTELWRSDGTRYGTKLVADVEIGSGSSNPRDITSFQNHVVFAATTQALSTEVWAAPQSGASDLYVHAPEVLGAQPGKQARLRVAFGNSQPGATNGAEVQLTLDPALSYVSDTSGTTPSVQGQTITWALDPLSEGETQAFTVLVQLPDAPVGSAWSASLEIAGSGQDADPGDNTQAVRLYSAYERYTPLIAQ